MVEGTEFDSPRELLTLTYWVLNISVGISFIIALVTDAMSRPLDGGAPRLMGLIIIGVLALVWVWLSSLGKEALREMT